MTRSAPAPALLLLADEVAGVHAEVGAAATHAYLAAAIDAVAHALVDVADGRSEASTATTPRELPPGGEEVGAASCAGAGAALRSVQLRAGRLLSGPDGIPAGLASDTVQALGVLADALQDLSTASADGRLPAVRPTAYRAVRRCHRMLQPRTTLGS